MSFTGRVVHEENQRTGAAEDPLGRRREERRESELAPRLRLAFPVPVERLQRVGRPALGTDDGERIERAGLALAPGAPSALGGPCRGGRLLRLRPASGIDEPRVDEHPLGVDRDRVGRYFHVLAHGFDQAVADDDGSVLDRLSRRRDDRAAGQGIDARPGRLRSGRRHHDRERGCRRPNTFSHATPPAPSGESSAGCASPPSPRKHRLATDGPSRIRAVSRSVEVQRCKLFRAVSRSC